MQRHGVDQNSIQVKYHRDLLLSNALHRPENSMRSVFRLAVGQTRSCRSTIGKLKL